MLSATLKLKEREVLWLTEAKTEKCKRAMLSEQETEAVCVRTVHCWLIRAGLRSSVLWKKAVHV